MKTNFLKTLLIALLPICAVSCIDNVPEEEVLPRDAVSFEYYIDQNDDPKYYLDFYIDSDITFKNTSPETTVGEPIWDFGDNTVVKGQDVVKHFYAKAGTYKVKLTIGDYTKEQAVMIAPIKPMVTIKYVDEVCEVRNTLVTFEVELPNPKNKPATFSWTFPQDTKNEYDEDYPTFEGKDINDLPAPVKFSHVGSQQVQLDVKLGEDDLEPTLLNVQVAYNKEVPTLYYAVVGGPIKAHKLAGDAPADMNIYSYDLGVNSGQHPLNILFKDSLLYVLDAGKQFYYVNDVNGTMGDGKISVVAKDGSKVQTMITNAGQAAFDDPFYGCIDGDFLYYANRNTGIVKIALTDRDKVYSLSEYPWYVQQATLGYYNNGWGYGVIGGMFGKINGTWHWAKFYNGNGIYRFVDSDILPAAVAKGDDSNKPKAGIMLEGMWHKSFVYTAKSPTPKMVLHIMDPGYNGVYAATYEEFETVGTSKNAIKPYAITYEGKMFESNTAGNLASKEGTGTESIGICQMTYDEINDCVYFAYRNNAPGGADKFPASGIYSYNVATGVVTCLIEGVEAYGVAVNNNPSKLF
ncbi:MAG: PKD domain-containing protein [Paludibacteraceae bacterium]|nr:PKD domain-containing protein [Paludibacteraceae bacterium]